MPIQILLTRSNTRLYLVVLMCAIFGCLTHQVTASQPFITGVIEDHESIPIIMPRLPGGWQRAVVWLAEEGRTVEEGELIARLDRGELEEEEEQYRATLEEQSFAIASQIAQHELDIVDAETELYQARTQLAITKIDAAIPIEAVTELDHENAQLAYENAKNRTARAEANLANSKEKLAKLIPVTETQTENTVKNWEQVRDALNEVDVHATRSGIMIYGENPRTGVKIFPGETLTPGTTIAMIANQDNLQFVFWVHDIDRLKFDVGTELMVTPDALPSEPIEATVDFIANYAIERSNWSTGGYFKLVATPKDTLPIGFLPGMAVVGEIDA